MVTPGFAAAAGPGSSGITGPAATGGEQGEDSTDKVEGEDGDDILEDDETLGEFSPDDEESFFEE